MKTNNMRLVQTTASPRDDLRSAIQHHADVVNELARISSAKVHAHETSTAAGARLHDLQNAFDDAKRVGDAVLAARALGEVDAAPQVNEADLQRATADREVAKRTERALVEREEQQGARVNFALMDLENAASAVLRYETTDTAAVLLEKARKTQSELVALRAELKYLFNAKVIAEPLASDVRSYLNDVIGALPSIDGVERWDFGTHPSAARWRAAYAKLRVDASAPLPE